jgi:hypothetical protein
LAITTVADPNYTRVLRRARARGLSVIGYVSTRYAARPLAEVKADVDRWIRLYPDTRGIFFDEQASTAGRVSYYAALYEYARKECGLALVVTNPGTACAEEYLVRPAADVVCLAEAPKGFRNYPAWARRYPAHRFAALVYTAGDSAKMRLYIGEMEARGIGYCYVTEAAAPAPWARLPRYWEEEAEAVRRVNEGQAP